MKCPGCRYPLIVLEIDDVEIENCLACGGVWLDAGELEQLLSSTGNKDALIASIADNPQSTERKVRCPICDKRMKKVKYGTKEKIDLDRCPAEHGLWFDHGELLEAIRRGTFEPDDRVYRLLHEIFGNKSTS